MPGPKPKATGVKTAPSARESRRLPPPISGGSKAHEAPVPPPAQRFRIQQFHRSETYSVSLRYLSRLAPGALLLLLLL
jgi:hypothetical protein